jgi:hypothetical protein
MSVEPRAEHFPPYIYGLHEAGGERLMTESGRPGWVLEMAAIGRDPGHVPAADYTSLARQGLRVIVRINHGFGSSGTIPRPEHYGQFAEACAAFVSRSRGAQLWIIGNEPNHEVERPDGQLILPGDYAKCYHLCRTAIHRVPGHQADQVLVAGPALWNATTRYRQNPAGDWVKYFAHILAALGAGECDGMAIHTYTHLHDPNKIRVDIPHPSPGYHHLRDEFRSYRDLMEAIPTRFRHLPVYITEADPTERHRGWGDGRNNGWVRTAYEEIADWNRNTGRQPIQALVLYRWFKAGDQPEWSIVDRPGVQEDFRQAMRSEPANRFRVPLPSAPSAGAPAKPKPKPESSGPVPDVTIAPGFTNQHLIDAFYRAGQVLMPARPWGLMSKAGLRLALLARERQAVYVGVAIDEMTRLSPSERRMVKWKLSAIYAPAPDKRNGTEPQPEVSMRGPLRWHEELGKLSLAPPDELVLATERSEDSETDRVVRTWNRYGWLLTRIADILDIEPGAAVAVAATDLSMDGFAEDGRLIIRFENHLFLLGLSQQHAEMFHRYFRFDLRYPWLEHRWRPDPNLPWRECHLSQDSEWEAFEFAEKLDDTAARMATVMGASRLPGLLYADVGHMSVDQMMEDFAESENNQVIGLFDFIGGPNGNSRRLTALRAGDFYAFAALHRGPDHTGAYGATLQRLYESFQSLHPIDQPEE